MTESTVCPICCENLLLEYSDLNEVQYRNHTTKLTIEYSICPDCGEQANTEQAKRNQQRMTMWKMEIDHKLDGNQ
jgi:hypothetical protein